MSTLLERFVGGAAAALTAGRARYVAADAEVTKLTAEQARLYAVANPVMSSVSPGAPDPVASLRACEALPDVTRSLRLARAELAEAQRELAPLERDAAERLRSERASARRPLVEKYLAAKRRVEAVAADLLGHEEETRVRVRELYSLGLGAPASLAGTDSAVVLADHPGQVQGLEERLTAQGIL